MKVKKIKIEDMTDEMIKAEIGSLEGKINSKVIEWENSKGDKRQASYSLFSHTGKLLVAREEDEEGWDAGMAVHLKVESERRASKGDMVSVKASHSIKAGTCSATVRTAGMKADKSEVTCQLADAQKLQGQVRTLRVELLNRAEKAKQAALDAERARLAKEVEEYLTGGQGVPSTYTVPKIAEAVAA